TTEESNTVLPVDYKNYNDNINQSRYWLSSNDLIDPVEDEENNDDGDTPAMQISQSGINWDNLGLSELDDLEDEDFPLKISWVTQKTASNYTGKIIYKKNFYIHRTNNGYRFSKSDSNNTSYFFDLNNLTSQDIPYFLFQLSKDKVNALR